MERTRSPVHHICCTFVGTEEEYLGFAVEVDDSVFDTRCLAWYEEVDDGVDVFLECGARVGTKGGEDGTFCASFGYVLVL